jgi:peptidoglycan/xylan/chitin deacetylase (PgdA/CDA1 family)
MFEVSLGARVNVKTQGERVLAWLFRLMGGLSDGRSEGPGGQAVLLAYHRILPRDRLRNFPFLEDLVTPEESFIEQMGLLAARFRVLPLEEIFRILREGGRVAPRTIGVTFDDGYADNYHFAWPVLRRLRLPATVFLTTGHVGGARGLFWWDEVSRWRSAGLATVEIEGLGRRPVATLRERDRLLEDLKHLPVDEVIHRVRAASERAGLGPVPDVEKEFLSWDQVREMQTEGIRFGSHTASHCLLPRETAERRRAELVESRATIARETGRPCTLFCYPNGTVTEPLSREVREAGFAGAVATRGRDVVQEAGLDLYRLPRKCINYRVGMTVFRFRLSPHPERIKRLSGRGAGVAA